MQIAQFPRKKKELFLLQVCDLAVAEGESLRYNNCNYARAWAIRNVRSPECATG